MRESRMIAIFVTEKKQETQNTPREKDRSMATAVMTTATREQRKGRRQQLFTIVCGCSELRHAAQQKREARVEEESVMESSSPNGGPPPLPPPSIKNKHDDTMKRLLKVVEPEDGVSDF